MPTRPRPGTSRRSFRPARRGGPAAPPSSRSRRAAALALAALLVAAAPSGAQVVMGTVTDRENGRGVEGAVVEVMEPDGSVRATASTSASGRFLLDLEALRPEDILSVRAFGYGEQLVPLGDLPDFSSSGVDVELSIPPEPLAVEGVVATVRARRLSQWLVQAGFYERQFRSSADFLEVDENRRRQVIVPSDYLRPVAGILFDQRGPNNQTEPRFRRAEGNYGFRGGNCYPAIYVDGVLMRRGGQGRESHVESTPFDAIVAAEHVQGIEVYASPSQLPPRFQGSHAGCGVIVVWTRG